MIFLIPTVPVTGRTNLQTTFYLSVLGWSRENHAKAVFNNITDIIEVKNNGHLSCGLVGIQWLMRGLTENGRSDLAYKIATNTTYPGWGYMVEKRGNNNLGTLEWQHSRT